MSGSEIPNLVGKVVAVKYGSGDRDIAYIEASSMEVQDGRRFLVGKTVNTPWDSAGGIRFCVAWDAVTAYYEFESVEHCRNTIASWYPPRNKWGFLSR